MKRLLSVLFVVVVLPMMTVTSVILAQSLRSLLRTPFNIVESKWEINENTGGNEFSYYNNDYCDYYLFRLNDKSYKLRPGKNLVFTIKKGESGNLFKIPSSYKFFRGSFPKDFNIAFPYALPVKDGSRTAWKTDKRESLKTLNFYMHSGDTVYATRSGIVCQGGTENQVLVYHSDHTFAGYMMLQKKFVEPGFEVCTGEPLGLASKNGVSISFFFLDENKFEHGDAVGYAYSHFVPVFRTSEGDVKLKENKMYQAVIDDALVMQEMSKREQKRYLKSKKRGK